MRGCGRSPLHQSRSIMALMQWRIIFVDHNTRSWSGAQE